MARKSWFNSIMGERYESKWSPEDLESDTIFPLPNEVSHALQMNLDNEAHEKFRSNKIIE
jgi:hypothetical protein